ncbi:hypothetical protein BV25DRAFT_966968 [Artomyces pyxidatus]|uniref:Uncharacterized protein n=1 Tax=Artomyces pyxidatus TaxID=48021 RepID=A0ACB8SX39_9AGAM|nr:hypothetical protein BV25DRAFT_966968 [Artomyces pyxidatus]
MACYVWLCVLTSRRLHPACLQSKVRTRVTAGSSAGSGPGLLVPVWSSSMSSPLSILISGVNSEIIPSYIEFGRHTASCGRPCLVFDHTSALSTLLLDHLSWGR